MSRLAPEFAILRPLKYLLLDLRIVQQGVRPWPHRVHQVW